MNTPSMHAILEPSMPSRDTSIDNINRARYNAKQKGYTVGKAISLRICSDLVSNSIIRYIYSVQTNVAMNLMMGSLFFMVFTPIIHSIMRTIKNSTLKLIFGKKWKYSWLHFRSMIMPTIFQSSGLLLKHEVVKLCGIASAEMLSDIGIPLQLVVQYFVNGIGLTFWGSMTGLLGLLSCLIAAWTVPIQALGYSTISAFFNCLRASYTVKSNITHDEAVPDLNLVLQSIVSLVVYMPSMTMCSDFSWSALLATIPLYFNFHIVLYMSCALLSNLCVFLIYALASPFTSQIAVQVKGLTLTSWDLFGIDYLILSGIETTLQFFYVWLAYPILLILGCDSCPIMLDLDRIQFVKENILAHKSTFSPIRAVAFSLKSLTLLTYALDKRILLKKSDLESSDDEPSSIPVESDDSSGHGYSPIGPLYDEESGASKYRRYQSTKTLSVINEEESGWSSKGETNSLEDRRVCVRRLT